MTIKVMIADDDRALRQAFFLSLMGDRFSVVESRTLRETFDIFVREEPDILFLDMHFQGEGTCLQILEKLGEQVINTPVIILSGAASPKESAEAIKLGAHDFLEKPISNEKLLLCINKTIDYFRMKKALNKITVDAIKSSPIIGQSKAISLMKKKIDQYAARDVKVLITGETGTGKEVVAQNLWSISRRAGRPFVIVNSAAIPDELIESELFGHKKGSFTGATHDQVGKIEMADKGTLFLDEIGDLSPRAQIKLLRFLETGEIQPLGTNRILKIDVRLIAATSRDLEKEIENGRFREDLFFRLNVAQISVPPLRERKEDIPELFTYFVLNLCRKFGEKEKIIDDETFEILSKYSWPGNIRELRNVAERAVLSSGSKIVGKNVLGLLGAIKKSSAQDPEIEIMPLKDFKRIMEKKLIEKVLGHTNGSVVKAAKLLDIDRAYLHQKMNQLSIK